MPELMRGKRGLIMGVANERSIAWGIAKALAFEGAELAFSYQGEAFGKRVEPLAASVGSDFLVDVNVIDRTYTDADGNLQTDQRAEPFPNGASGWMSIFVDVA